MYINIIYKVQTLNTKSGFWEILFNFPQEEYHNAITKLYDCYKFDNTKVYRLIQEKQELIDILYPPGYPIPVSEYVPEMGG